MISSVLKSDRAAEVNVVVMRVFVQLRQGPDAQSDVMKRLEQLERASREQTQMLLDAINRFGEVVPYTQTPRALDHPEKVSRIETANPPPVFTDHENGFRTIIDKRLSNVIEAIQKAVADYYHLRIQDLKIPTRMRKISLPRQIAIYLIRKRTKLGFREIGEYFGGKDHTTILYAFHKIETCIDRDEAISDALRCIEASLKA